MSRKECPLEMFRVHQAHAARLHFDPGQIGEPYVIYRISKEKILQLH